MYGDKVKNKSLLYLFFKEVFEVPRSKIQSTWLVMKLEPSPLSTMWSLVNCTLGISVFIGIYHAFPVGTKKTKKFLTASVTIKLIKTEITFNIYDS